ncbi:hypothetical protein ACFWAN_52565 [Streptomyces mirabilis]|uniref:hypothetical protein n=1 Tax=Streptomyces mirabilis TaxID=68239 RepID=UPI003647F4CB
MGHDSLLRRFAGIRNIALDADGPVLDGFHGCVQLGSVPAREVPGGALGDEPTGYSQTDPGRAVTKLTLLSRCLRMSASSSM